MSPSPYSAMGMVWWLGYQLITADGASQALLKRAPQNTIAPSTGTHDIVTSSNWMISCLPTTASGAPGEAYLATAPDGTRYWFNHLVYGPAIETLVRESGGGGFGGREASRPGSDDARIPQAGTPGPSVYADGVRSYLPRKLAYMYVTRIEDRFGNAVTYNYSGARPVSISASDGRVVEIEWGTNGFVSSIVMQPGDAKKRTWQYEYSAGRLARVVLPDGSNWAYSMAAVDSLEPWILEDEGLSTCGLRSFGARAPGSHEGAFTAVTMTHPSGLVGTFDIGIALHARSNVPSGCDAYGQFEQTPLIYQSYSLVGKRFSGPGIATKRWYYDYSPIIASSAAECQASGCVGTSYVDVTAPDDSVTRYIHSSRWDASEGKLMGIVRGLSTSFEPNPVGLESITKTWASPTAGPYPSWIGESFELATNRAPAETISPELQTTIVRQGVTFTNRVNSFDVYGAPLSVTRSSTGAHDGAFNRTEITTYRHDSAKWVVGQVERVTDATSGKIITRSEYDSAKSLPVRSYRFEMLQQTLAYDAAGNLVSVKDGRNNTTTLGGWVRGLPTSIDFPTGAELGAEVDALGQITSTTDELGSRTCYGYDSLGRLASTTLTSESAAGTCNASAWNPSSRGFVKVAAEEYGIPGPHWRQTVQTGDAKSTTWYDALLQPVLSLTEDVTRPDSRSFVVTRYDAMGRPEFASYPVGSLTRIDQALSGVRTSYDVLGRVTATHQDSELVDGKTVLSTATSYLPGFRTQVSNPRGHSTTTSFQVFDAPSTEHPLTISLPEGVTTRIVRDSFGKPLSITRSGGTGANAATATRSYVYDSNERLCKTINPESGATLLDYDAAGNIAWSADGTALTTLVCNRGSVTAAMKTTRSYDALNRITTVTTPGGKANQTRSYHADGKLKLLTASNPGGPDVSTSYEYNRRRLLTSETSSNGSTVYSIDYDYTANGHASSLGYPDMHEVSYSPDALGRATQVRGSDGTVYASAIAYYPGGAMSGFVYGNGVVHSMIQNARRLPARSKDVKGSLVVLDDSYTFDANGNVFDITDRTQGKQIIRAMGYDGLDRLTAVLADNLGTPAANDALWGVATYAYDALDNISSADLGTRKYRYAYDAVTKRLATIKNPAGALAFGFSYDANGNATAKNTGAGCGSDLTLQCAGKPSQALVFDSANRLNEVTGVQSYRYDGEGRRVQATDADGDSDPTNDPRTFWIYGQDGKVLYTSEARRSQTLGYIYLGNTQVATRAKPWGSMSVTLGYQHTDALGSPTVETNAAGAVTKRMAYTPYGESWGGAIDGTGYTGHVMDAGTGLTYMQQRYYDPQDRYVREPGSGDNGSRKGDGTSIDIGMRVTMRIGSLTPTGAKPDQATRRVNTKSRVDVSSPEAYEAFGKLAPLVDSGGIGAVLATLRTGAEGIVIALRAKRGWDATQRARRHEKWRRSTPRETEDSSSLRSQPAQQPS